MQRAGSRTRGTARWMMGLAIAVWGGTSSCTSSDSNDPESMGGETPADPSGGDAGKGMDLSGGQAGTENPSGGNGSGGGEDGSGGGKDGSGGGGRGGAAAAGGSSGDGETAWVLPPENAGFDYQLGGAYEPPSGVRVVIRDREDPPAVGLYNICYVNGFQTQPQDNEDWAQNHPDLLVPGPAGEPLLDEDWGEYLFDISTKEKRARLLELLGPWIDRCKEDGFDAIEVDNLDSYSRSAGHLEEAHAIAFLHELAQRAHEQGLAVGQKNATELLPFAEEMGTDFAIAEECNRYDECADYQSVYQGHVFIIEYRKQDFDEGCKNYPELSVVLRDLNVSPSRSPDYVYEGC